MERWRGKVAVVTGASAGIGAAVAYQLQDAGLTVVALARRTDKIPDAVEAARRSAEKRGRGSLGQSGQRGKLYRLKCDVSKEQDVLDAFKWAKYNVGGVDVLVNNAGVIGEHRLNDASGEEWKKIVDSNILGLSVCTKEAVKQMKARGVDDGHIIHIGSISGPYPSEEYPTSMYVAFKNAMRSLSEGVRKELLATKSRIKVTEICPGNVKTDLWTNMTTMNGKEWQKSFPCLEYDDVSEATLYALMTPHVQTHDRIINTNGELS